MKPLALTTKKRLILGLGETGLSVARYLASCGQEFKVMDSRENPPGKVELAELASDALIGWERQSMKQYDELVVSPGIAISHPDIKSAIQAGVCVIGDIELFAQVNQKPVIAITGSNGKSTVTELVAELIDATEKSAAIGGNFGIPALDLIDSDADYIVLELSSFQLETTHSLKPICATILNVSEDHLDRYESYQAYIETKKRVYQGAQTILINKDDCNTFIDFEPCTSFALQNADWDLDEGKEKLLHNNKTVLELKQLSLQGIHNALNVAAALALVELAGLCINSEVIAAACKYKGLPHRCELAGQYYDVTYINDSKATNVGATIAAIESFSPQFKNIILIAGGDAKGADLSVLKNVIDQNIKSMICFGQDSKALQQIAPAKSFLVNDLEQAVTKAKELAVKDDLVLLSPACASMDMFDNYIERGNRFMELVRLQHDH